MSDGGSPGCGNHWRVDEHDQDIYQQLELTLCDAEKEDEDEDEDYDDFSIYSPDDEDLSDDYDNINLECVSYNVVLDQDDAVWHHRAAFYKMNTPMLKSVTDHK
jgi:hypothetical protein